MSGDSCAAARAACLLLLCCSSERHKFQNYVLPGMRVKQTDHFGPIRASGNNNFWRPTTAKLPIFLAHNLRPAHPRTYVWLSSAQNLWIDIAAEISMCTTYIISYNSMAVSVSLGNCKISKQDGYEFSSHFPPVFPPV